MARVHRSRTHLRPSKDAHTVLKTGEPTGVHPPPNKMRGATFGLYLWLVGSVKLRGSGLGNSGVRVEFGHEAGWLLPDTFAVGLDEL